MEEMCAADGYIANRTDATRNCKWGMLRSDIYSADVCRTDAYRTDEPLEDDVAAPPSQVSTGQCAYMVLFPEMEMRVPWYPGWSLIPERIPY